MMPNQNNTTTWATMDANTTQSSNHTTTRNQAHTTRSYNLESTKMMINISNVTMPSENACQWVPNWCLPPPCIPCPPPRPTIFDCQPDMN